MVYTLIDERNDVIMLLKLYSDYTMPVINYTVESESAWTLRGTQSPLFKDDLRTLEIPLGATLIVHLKEVLAVYRFKEKD